MIKGAVIGLFIAFLIPIPFVLFSFYSPKGISKVLIWVPGINILWFLVFIVSRQKYIGTWYRLKRLKEKGVFDEDSEKALRSFEFVLDEDFDVSDFDLRSYCRQQKSRSARKSLKNWL